MSRRSSARHMIPSSDYHSAHRAPHDSSPLDRWEGGGCLAFVHDLMSAETLPAEFDQCDVLTAEIPWRRGFETFNERAGVDDDRTYAAFLRRVADIVEATTVPVYLLTGKHALSRLPKADTMTPTKLNEWDALILGYRGDPEIGDTTYGVTQELLYTLAQRYNVAGDFCCGYGRTGRLFLRSGKRAVLSDYNAKCIGHIAANAISWIGPQSPF